MHVTYELDVLKVSSASAFHDFPGIIHMPPDAALPAPGVERGGPPACR